MCRTVGTLRTRVVLAAALSTLVVLVGVGGIVLAGARRDARNELDRRLQARAAQVARLPAVVGLRARSNVSDLAGGDLGVRVVLRGGLAGSAGRLPRSTTAHLPARAGVRTYAAAAGDRWRAATVQVAGRPRLLVEASAPLSTVDDAVRSLRRRVVVVGFAGLLVAMLLAGTAGGYAVRSLGRLRRVADDVATTDHLDRRVPEDGPAEVHAVAAALNAMLSRLERSTAERERALESTKRFAADAGHELRTPLAVLQTGLETLARNPDLPAEQRREILEETLDEHRRLAALVSALQALTRGDGGAMGDEQPVDLADVVRAAVAAARRDHPGTTFATALDPTTPEIVGSPTGLRLLVDNLVQNAARHGAAPGSTASVRVSTVPAPGGRIVLSVEDDGPGIPEDDAARVVDRFVRGSTAQGDGSGLGLAIAMQQGRRHGGGLSIGRSASGGARVSVELTGAAGTDLLTGRDPR